MSWGTEEFGSCGVEDKRESKSQDQIADRLLANPSLSFSSTVGNSLRRAAWRIFSIEAVDVSFGNYKQTSQRCSTYATILVSQDTTDINYQTHYDTTGLGDLGGHKQIGHGGICLHTAMAMNEEGLPLGLIGQKLWAPVASGRQRHARHYAIEEKESYRWLEALQWSKQYLNANQWVVIISDRESDFYEYMIAPRHANTELLLRSHHLNRRIYYQGIKQTLGAVAPAASTQITIQITPAKGRKARCAQLQVQWDQITLPPSSYKKGKPVILRLVKAVEISPHAKEVPISWHLLTTIPVEDNSTALQMLEYYRLRWLIERWHLVLKQGLQIERLQFNNFLRVSNAIKLIGIVVWQLLCFQQIAKQEADLKAELVFEPLHLEVLKKHQVKEQITLKEALLLIAKLAGFTPSKKQP